MLLGIDVGGTFTDTVLMKAGQIVKTAKNITTHDNLLKGILASIDAVMEDYHGSELKRITISSTIVTNALITGKTNKVNLFVIPGPGMNIKELLPGEATFLTGYVDHRGHVVQNIDENELKNSLTQKDKKNNGLFAVSGKFSVRNKNLELKVKDYITKEKPVEFITIASDLTGELNFLRRTISAYYNTAVWQTYNIFVQQVTEAFNQRGLRCPVTILKADGGTIPLDVAKNMPVETIFTGPAASVLGIMALNKNDEDFVAIDIGGTTTDISLWKKGQPIHAQKGACIEGYISSVKAFLLKSVGIGGDSYVRLIKGEVVVGPERYGQPMCLGGGNPTITDALRVLNLINYGDYNIAYKAIASLGNDNVEVMAQIIINKGAVKIKSAIEELISLYNKEPQYNVEDIINGQEFAPKLLIGVGGAAKGLTEMVGNLMKVKVNVPLHSEIANAIGAALSLPTTEISMRIDTEEGYLFIPELNIREKIAQNYTAEQAILLCEKFLYQRAKEMDIEYQENEVTYLEEFNLVRGFDTVGKIINCRMQLKPGVIINVG